MPQPEPNIGHYCALMAMAIEHESYIFFFAAKVCEYNLRLTGPVYG